MAEPRRSTDEEDAPLLRRGTEDQSFVSTLVHPPRKLTTLERVLAAVSIILLILMSTFIGLFASTEKRLKHETGRHDRGGHGHGGVSTTTKWATHTTTVASKPTGKPEPEVCLTAECVKLSAAILANLNTSVDPCDDFYQYATGGWQETHSIPEDRGLLGSFNEVSDNNKRILLKIINAIPDDSKLSSSAEDDNLHKLKAVYTSCMDTDRLNDLGLKPFEPLAKHLLDIFGPFDLIPAPDAEAAEIAADWVLVEDESYTVSEKLMTRSAEIDAIKSSRSFGRPTEAKPVYDLDSGVETESKDKSDDERVVKLTKTLAYLHSRGVDALFSFNVEGDAGGEDSQVQSLWFYQTSGGLPSKEYYEEKPILDLYTSVVADVLVDIASHVKGSGEVEKRDLIDDIVAEAVEIEQSGWPWPWPGDDKPKPPPGDGSPDNKTKEESLETRMGRLATKVVDFERELMRAGTDPEYLFNPHFAYNPYPAEKVDKHLPIIDVRSYLSTFGTRHFPENITVTYPPYLDSVSRLVADTPDYVLSGYFATRLAFAYSGALGPKVGVKQATKRLGDTLKGIKKGTEENRQDTCLAAVDDVVGFIAGREFVREAFSAEAKEDAAGIINAIVDAFYDKLPHIAWMDEPSYKAAQKKAKAMIPKVGYPLTPNTTDPESLQRWYSRVPVSSDDYFGSVLNTALLDQQRTWAGLGQKRDRQTWEMYPQTVNAYYSPPDGEIVFPAGILQSPFYSYEWPENLKYGAFGAVAAHELTHAFDNAGSQYDEHGRLREWWTNSTVKAFEERAQCIAKQYSKYYVSDDQGNKVYVNGNLTNGENIGDSGLAQAYSAWKSVTKSSSKELRLPGLDYTPEQLFFLSFARIWAQLARPATAVSRIRTDPHSPPYWRATGTLRNLDVFHKAFNCKAGSRMNPPKEDQCELW